MEPVETSVKNNKRGLGADKVKKKLKETTDFAANDRKNNLVIFYYFFWYNNGKETRTNTSLCQLSYAHVGM